MKTLLSLLALLRTAPNFMWVAALLLVAIAFALQMMPSPAPSGGSSDRLVLSVTEVNRLGGGTPPRWSAIRDAYRLTDRQMEVSACLTRNVSPCDRDLTRRGTATADPDEGRLILYLSRGAGPG
jgi:hypothetical protein